MLRVSLRTLGALMVAACFDPRAGTPCDGGACGASGDGRADAEPDGAAHDGPRGGAPQLVEGLFLAGDDDDVLSGVAASGAFGPVVAGTFGGGSGMLGATSCDSDQGPGDHEAVIAAVNSIPLAALPTFALPTPTSDGSSNVGATKIAVDTTLGLAVAIGTTRLDEPVMFGPDQAPVTCGGTWVAAWRLADGEQTWDHCFPGTVLLTRVRIHPTTHQVVVVGSWAGTFEGAIAMGVDGFAVTFDSDGDPGRSFVVDGPSDDVVVDLAPYDTGWLIAGQDARAGLQGQAVVWKVDDQLREIAAGVRLELGGAERDAPTALIAEGGTSGRYWLAVELGTATTIAGTSLSAGPALVAFDASRSALTAVEALAVTATSARVNALAGTPDGIVVVGSARGELSIGSGLAPGRPGEDQPFWGVVARDTFAVGPLEQLDLAGGQGALLDVEWQADGIFAVGHARGTLTIAGDDHPLASPEGILLRFAPVP